MEEESEGHGGPLTTNKMLCVKALPPPGPPTSSVKNQEQDGSITFSSKSAESTGHKKKKNYLALMDLFR